MVEISGNTKIKADTDLKEVIQGIEEEIRIGQDGRPDWKQLFELQNDPAVKTNKRSKA